MTFTSLPDALEWLESHVDFEASMPDRRSPPTLDRMRELAAVLGDPQQTIPSIHITGTNGKGSTAAMVTSLLMAMGLSVGTYTSPSLTTLNERLAMNATSIGDGAFLEVLNELSSLEVMLTDRPTRFELLTAAALTWFSNEAADVMVM